MNEWLVSQVWFAERGPLRLGDLKGRAGTFVDAAVLPSGQNNGYNQPVYLNERLDRKLWRALMDSSVTQFAQRFPFTVTPGRRADPGHRSSIAAGWPPTGATLLCLVSL
jgi:hypothetical protein